MGAEKCPLELAARRSGGRSQIAGRGKGVGSEGMEEMHGNSTVGQPSPAHMPAKLKIAMRVAGTSLKGSLLAISRVLQHLKSFHKGNASQSTYEGEM